MRFARLVNLLHRVCRNRPRRHGLRLRLRRNRRRDTNVDRISALSDKIICHILSNIDTKYAIATCFVLRRLKTVAPFLPNIILNDSFTRRRPYTEEHALDCAILGLRQLIRRSGGEIGRFEFECHRNFDDSAIQTLIRVVARENKVKEIIIKLAYRIDDDGSIPKEVFNCSSLELLKLAGGSLHLHVPSSLDLPKLKVLHFEELTLWGIDDNDDNEITRLFQACSKLEELYLLNVTLLEGFDLSSQTLTKLSFKFNGVDIRLSIDTPNLNIFEFEGNLPPVDVSSQFMSLDRVVVKVHYGNPGDEENLSAFSNNLHGVKSLYLSEDALKTICSRSSIYEALIVLELDAGDPRRVFDILELTPQLEVLVIHSYSLGIPSEEDVRGTSHMMTASVPVCLVENLWLIKFENFKVDGKAFHLVKYLLANGNALQTLKISALFDDWTAEMQETRSEILRLTRRSGTCEVVFDPPEPEKNVTLEAKSEIST